MIRLATAGASGPVAAQMAALDPDADLLTPEARQWLLAQARGSAERLRILMATAMFLAETEHAPSIDLDLAQRAGALQPDESPEASVTPPHAMPQRLKWGLALAAWTVLCVASGMALDAAIRVPYVKPAAPAPDIAFLASTPIALPTAPAGLPAAGGTVASHGPAAASSTDQPPAPLAAPPTPVIPRHQATTNDAVATQKLDAAIASLGAPAAPPVAPPPRPVPVVMVRFFLASPGAAPRARFIEQRLAEAGFITRMVPDTRVPPPRTASVVYFHAEDAATAQRAEATAVLLATRPVFARNTPQRRPVRGTIELMLP
jgi:hypothetical protein